MIRSQLVPVDFFIDIKSFRSHYGPGVDSASNRIEYQEYFLGGKGGRCLRLTTYHHPVPLSRNLGTLTCWNPLGHSGPVTGLLMWYYAVPLKYFWAPDGATESLHHFAAICMPRKAVCNITTKQEHFFLRSHNGLCTVLWLLLCALSGRWNSVEWTRNAWRIMIEKQPPRPSPGFVKGPIHPKLNCAV